MASPFTRPALVAGRVGAPNDGASIPSQAGTGPVSFAAVRGDVSDAMSGRITLAMLDLIILGLIGFYIVTKSAQGGS